MRTMISHYSNPNFPPKFPSSIPQINIKPSFYLHPNLLISPINTVPTINSCFRASCTAKSEGSFNGWDDLRVKIDSDKLGESNYLKKLIFLIGIDDKKYLFTCILGFVVALVISRIRVSSIVVFPAVVIVFGIGFSLGFFNDGTLKGFSSKDESFRVHVEKLRILEKLFDGFDVKVGELKRVVKKGIDDESVELSELERYVDVLESISGLVLDARNVVEDFGCELEETVKKSNQKSSRNKKEFGRNGFDLMGFFGSFVRDNGAPKSSKRNVFRRGSIAKEVDKGGRRDMRGVEVEQALDSVSSVNGSASRVGLSIDGGMNELGERNQEMERISQSRKMSEMDSRSFLDDGNDRFNYQSSRLVDNQSFSFNMSSHREFRKWTADDSIISSYKEVGFTKEQEENGNSWSSQQHFGDRIGGYDSNGSMTNVDFGNYNDDFSQERMNVEDELHTRKYQPRAEKDEGPFSSSTVSDDLMFNDYLTKANGLLKQAKECLKVGNDEIFAEEMLHKSANLLSQAITMKPMSLLAIGQLGNTYLLHGELKLRTTRALRNRLLRNENFSYESYDLLLSVNEARPNRDRIETLLGQTCEECETLLVQAGRKYRTALTIDGNDLRALYNWGLALFFRAQLIADIGPEAVPDADKLFMAAIDKFDAMMSKSNVCAPEALYRWGMALQQRSRLRPNSSRDRVKLLQQAKRLYKDALDMGSNNLQVREALSACMSELDFRDI
ncbi:uncharacterized protein LOC141637836 [Silene latifolia]|uniref:uncharacterized protein LOC141637836 n=1 Tax=Silene latifolia TaxID=37657 RepID=UPI003D77046E